MRFFFSKKVHILVSLFLVSSAWGLWRISSRSQKPVEEIIFATATKGGTYYPLGSQLGRIIEELPNRAVSRVKVIETNGSKDNISHLLTGYADVALVAVPALVEHEKDKDGKDIKK